MSKPEEKKDILRAPLQSGQCEIIYDNIDDRGMAEDVINIIEHTITSSDELNKFNLIVEALSPLIQDKAKLIVSKLYLYKRRPCKFGNTCKEPKCIFIHDKDKIKTSDNKRRIETEGSKRYKKEADVLNNREVIINRVDALKHTESDVVNYISQYGEIESYKKLNDMKWLILFRDSEAGKDFVNSRDAVIGDSSIKKYFNIVENMKKYELNSLIDKQEEILNKSELSNSDLEEMRRLLVRMKTLVKEIEDQSNKDYTKKSA